MTTNSKNNSYNSKHYDERQLIDRYRISFETLMLTFVLIFANGMIKLAYGPWAAENTEMMILLAIPTTYFLIRAVWKGAYFSAQMKSYTWSLVLFAILGLFNISVSIYSIMNGGTAIENGMPSENLFQFFLGIPFLAIPIVYMIKKAVTKEEDEE
ncbi:hypothetical protein MmiEs2_12860 [Methanimicrococcus stummii]|uniref:Uncharacterized protein n=1 Tax=Methanimicrococcus stummii TaxID=3028294 RepID=A0AA96VMZ4_9EURY|nr:DUF6773 family protein [Methanimicrococcus sp. Es2]WNY29072.1 hypothetical protein MmiEs2_12860 [Methanimicrococcus sp. Es2]